MKLEVKDMKKEKANHKEMNDYKMMVTAWAKGWLRRRRRSMTVWREMTRSMRKKGEKQWEWPYLQQFHGKRERATRTYTYPIQILVQTLCSS